MKHCALESLEGLGGELEFKITGERIFKARLERTEITLKVCRGTISELMVQIKAMHARDADRIARELARIEKEKRALL